MPSNPEDEDDKPLPGEFRIVPDVGGFDEELEDLPAEAHDETPWACFACGSMEGFETVWYLAGDCDVECRGCGSVHTGEATDIMKQLVERVDTLESTLTLASAILEKLDASPFTDLDGYRDDIRIFLKEAKR